LNLGPDFRPQVVLEIVDAKHFRAVVDAAPSPPFFAWVFTFGGAIRIDGHAGENGRQDRVPGGIIFLLLAEKPLYSPPWYANTPQT